MLQLVAALGSFSVGGLREPRTLGESFGCRLDQGFGVQRGQKQCCLRKTEKSQGQR